MGHEDKPVIKRKPGACEVSAALKKSKVESKIRRFVSATHELVTYLDTESPDVVSWSRSGELFIVKNKHLLSKELSKYFNTSKFESFTKQLNIYGFIKGTPGWDIVDGQAVPLANDSGVRFNEEYSSFWHPFFKRGRIDLLHKVNPAHRKSKKEPCHVVTTDTSETVEIQSVEYWRNIIKNLEIKIADRKAQIESDLDAIQLQHCESIQEIAERVQHECKLRIEGDRGMFRELPPISSSDIEAEKRRPLNPWCYRPPRTAFQEKLHASALQVFDVSEPFVFEEFGLHDLLNHDFKFTEST